MPQLRDGEMDIELRKGRFYLYDRRRANGRLRCEYHGAVPPHGAALLRLSAAEELAKRERKRKEAEAEVERAEELLAIGTEFDELANRLFRVVMLLDWPHAAQAERMGTNSGVAAMGKLEEIAPAPTGAKTPAPTAA